MRYTLAEIAAKVGGEVIGDKTLVVTGINSLEAATADELSFAEEKFLKKAISSKAGALLVPRETDDLHQPLIICDQPFRAAGRIMTEIDEANQMVDHSIDQTASIGENVSLGSNLHIGPGAVISNDAVIGDKSRIYANTFIGKGVIVGSECRLYPGVVIRENCSLGNRVIIHPNSVIGSDGFGFLQVGGCNVKIPQIGRVIIEDDVEIGALCTVNRAAMDETVIGRGTKLDDHVHLGHGVKVGHEVIMCAQVGISGSVRIGNQVMLGPRVGMVDHLTIGDRARLMVGTSVTKSLAGDIDYGGTPAVPVKQALRQMMAATHLPKDRGRLAALEKKVQELEQLLQEPGTKAQNLS
ncbi:MAG: UDP-3-O-(3-hydroxymyristoyl)glucosamine N-acyltransferase [Deltaproteobacteria bacterium]|nr:UDP-3-O-(3-hydroxymyristoyl)glucosamine N-acyltransferase [Deltaproteobacteria bacterium]